MRHFAAQMHRKTARRPFSELRQQKVSSFILSKNEGKRPHITSFPTHQRKSPPKIHHGPSRGTAQEAPDQAGQRPSLPEGRGELDFSCLGLLMRRLGMSRASGRKFRSWLRAPPRGLGHGPMMALASINPTDCPRIKVRNGDGCSGSASLGPSDARGTKGPLNSHQQIGVTPRLGYLMDLDWTVP